MVAKVCSSNENPHLRDAGETCAGIGTLARYPPGSVQPYIGGPVAGGENAAHNEGCALGTLRNSDHLVATARCRRAMLRCGGIRAMRGRFQRRRSVDSSPP